MKTRRKAIIGYIVNWIAIIIFAFFAYIAYKAGFNNLFLSGNGSFGLGVVFGVSFAMFLILLTDVLTSVAKYVWVKIRKTPSSFIDILVKK